jgi:GTPase SAR1 family protein
MSVGFSGAESAPLRSDDLPTGYDRPAGATRGDGRVRAADAPPPLALLTVLVRLRQVLEETTFPLDAADADDARADRSALIQQLEDYVIPRLLQIEAPLLMVVGGSTGAGKSTLVNSLVGRPVTEADVLRPTTRSPVLVHHPADAKWFGPDRLLPDLIRTDRVTTDRRTLQLVAADEIPQGLAIIDAPDVDSVEHENRVLAGQLMSAADLWVFVTSAARYADQVPWDFLRSAARRSTAIAVVLDRTTPQSVREVGSHLARMLNAKGLGDSPLFTVPESPVDREGLLPRQAVASIRAWLDRLAADEYSRLVVVRKTLNGTVRSITPRVHALADAHAKQLVLANRLQADAKGAYDGSLPTLHRALHDGSLLTGEILARWDQVAVTGELVRSLEDHVSGRRGRPARSERAGSVVGGALTAAVGSGLATMIGEHAASAAERAAMCWRADPAGQRLLDTAPNDLARPSLELATRTESTVREWQHEVLELVRKESADRRASARFLADGVNGLAVALMVVVLAPTDQADRRAGGRAAAAARKLLEVVFGEHTLGRLTGQARADLLRGVAELWSAELRRYLDVLASHPTGTHSAGSMHDLASKVDEARVVGVTV